ncbi:MAG TPA: hypothetical protein VHB01_13455 [Nitrosospira sp.]|nr:hypothetical protein [Nitrosospira sp.]
MKKQITPMEGYANLMTEIKKRAEVIEFFLSGKGHALYTPTTAESVCLQIRKILELIAFSSLIANAKAYETVHKDFAIHWNAKKLLDNLERINPDFFPSPVSETPREKNDIIRMECATLTDGFLTKVDFVHIYNKCGGMLHARNPYDGRDGYHYVEKSMRGWMQKIVKLLQVHTIKSLGQKGFWLIHMHENKDGRVYVYDCASVAWPPVGH